jgi:hypothetical protein
LKCGRRGQGRGEEEGRRGDAENGATTAGAFAVWARIGFFWATGLLFLFGATCFIVSMRMSGQRSARTVRLLGQVLMLNSFVLAMVVQQLYFVPVIVGRVGWDVRMMAVTVWPIIMMVVWALQLGAHVYTMLRPVVTLYNHTGGMIQDVELVIDEGDGKTKSQRFQRLRPWAKRRAFPSRLHVEVRLSYTHGQNQCSHRESLALNTGDRFMLEILANGKVHPHFTRSET